MATCSGVRPFLPWMLGSASFCSSRRATLMLPYFAAIWRGVNPFCKVKGKIWFRKGKKSFLNSFSQLANAVVSVSHNTSYRRRRQTLVVRFWLAPCSSRTAATSSCPSLAAMCSGVYRSLVVASGDAPCCNSNTTLSTFPRREAMWSGVCCSCKTASYHHY